MKSAQAFRTISEAADEIGVAQHVLRFWETKFSFVRPMKRAGGRRFYRPSDIAVLATVRRLLHQEGYTIKAVQKLNRDQGIRRLAGGEPAIQRTIGKATLSRPDPILRDAPRGNDRARLEAALFALESAKAKLDGLLHRS